MKINANGKSGIIIGVVSVATGLVIYGGSKLIGLVKNHKKKDDMVEVPVEEVVDMVEKSVEVMKEKVK